MIGLSACVKRVVDEEMPFHAVAEPYVLALAEAAGVVPVVLPSLPGLDPEAVLAPLDGLLLTGSVSNVSPVHYDSVHLEAVAPLDHQRDAAAMALVPAAIRMGVPLLAICRGLQEVNVALGGTLFPKIHEVPGRMDHRPPEGDLDTAFAPVHTVRLEDGGLLRELAGASDVMVNSLHGQGIDRLAPGLEIEAVAPDGQIEAVRVAGAPAFSVAVQWHPEWHARNDPFSAALFRAFGEAAARRHASRA